MASPQVEDGHIKIAFDLLVGIYQSDLTALQFRILLVVMNLTYGAGKTKAEMSISDIRYQLGARDGVRSDRVAKAVDDLLEKNVLFRQAINQSGYLLGIQKDYENWGAQIEKSDKMSPHVVFKSISNITTVSDKMSPAQILASYAVKKLGLKLSLRSQIAEMGRAKLLYTEATQLIHSPAEALVAIQDYVDYCYENPWFRDEVRSPFAYMLKGFERWYKAIPKKTRDIREQEQAIGYRHKYNFKTKRWEPSSERIKPNP